MVKHLVTHSILNEFQSTEVLQNLKWEISTYKQDGVNKVK